MVVKFLVCECGVVESSWKEKTGRGGAGGLGGPEWMCLGLCVS